MSEPTIWSETLATWSNEGRLLSAEFMAQYGAFPWGPSLGDKHAAAQFHIELISRISTQPLSYSEGTEKSALASVFRLFEKARQVAQTPDLDGTFENIVWDVLNTHVRPFTAKWHRKSKNGRLDALDTSDVFRSELAIVQERLVALDEILVLMAGGNRVAVKRTKSSKDASIEDEMEKHKAIWRPAGIIKPPADSDIAVADLANARLRDAEFGMVESRRHEYGEQNRGTWACGLALSGGGIRSATFAMGVLASLARRNLLKQFDYLSTVSGGGYAGSFLTQLLGLENTDGNYGLDRDKLPFLRNEGESSLLQKVRNNSSYLSGSFTERLFLAVFQAKGVLFNILALSLIVLLSSLIDFTLGKLLGLSKFAFTWLPLIAILVLFVTAAVVRADNLIKNKWAGRLGISCLLIIIFSFFQAAHALIGDTNQTDSTSGYTFFRLVSLGALAIAIIGVTFSRRPKMRPMLIATFTGVLLIGVELASYRLLATNHFEWSPGLLVVAVIDLVIFINFFLAFDVNSTSLNSYYRGKLSKAFLLNIKGEPAVLQKLSCFDPTKAIFPIINCAVNLPGSSRADMRGRHSDLLSFTPVAGGARVLGYKPMTTWEDENPQLDLSLAMALSGAAVSPQMGLNTEKYASFWLTFLNLRLNAWLRQPGKNPWANRPTALQLFQEAFATNSEISTYVNVSDGGHIENLGVYELLRRRCRFIVAVDGEQDASMTFHGLTNLQRLAYIDMGITLEIDLDDLRLGDKGLSRSHFRFCRIRYPDGDKSKGKEIGYLVYLKLSLTGNEGEFIKRYKFDDPAFPHNSTSNQFFTEVQFEAYRALGEHVGEKMFLKALTNIDDSDEIDIEKWFEGLGKSFLDPLVDDGAHQARQQ